MRLDKSTQNILLASGRFERERAYWDAKLAGDCTWGALPSDLAGRTKQGQREAWQTFLPEETAKRVLQVSNGSDTALFMILLSGVHDLLYRYTGNGDALVATPIFQKESTGQTVNTLLPMRTPLDPAATCREFLGSVRQTVREAGEHQNFPFGDLTQWVQGSAEATSSIGVLVLLHNLQNAQYAQDADAQLAFSFERRAESVALTVDWRADLYSQGAIEKFTLHLSNFLQQALEDTTRTIGRIDVLSAAERQRLLYDFNSTVTPYAREKTIHQLFEEQAAKTPERIALTIGDQQVTYRRLNEQANRIARLLVEQGIGNNDNVALLAERNVNMIAGMYAIMKTGAAYVPIDPDYPASRQEQIAASADVAAVLTDLTAEREFARTIKLEAAALERYEADDLGLAKNSGELAYTIYTSGSTGLPKGVMIEHHSAVNLIEWVNREFAVDEHDVMLFITSMCFDLSVYDIFGILAAGGRVVMAQKEQVHHSEALLRLMKQEGVTFWDSVPTTMNHLINTLDEIDPDYRQEQLRLVFMSGDWIPVQLPGRIQQYFPEANVIALGGATEGTVWSNYYPIEEVSPEQKSIPYGRPIANNYFYVLDDQQNPVPQGVVGELYIGGVGVARGYMNDAVRTGAAFFQNPFLEGEDERMYKTGDLGRMLPDGNLEFIGRKDHQVKIRGFRVELGEIDSWLNKHEAIKEAVVLDRTDPSGAKYLCAYVVLKEELSTAALREELRAALPAYMVPSYFVKLEQLPLTSNGKIDRQALPEPDQNDRGTPYVAPRTETEQVLAGLWQSVLGVERVGVQDNFFDLGGDSLKGTTLVSRMHKRFEVLIPLDEIFRSQTVEQLALQVEGADKKAFSAIGAIAEQDAYEVSSAQKRLLLIHEHEGASTSYNMPSALTITGLVDAKRLEAAFQQVIAKHEALRTSFAYVDGEPVQRILPAVEFTLALAEAGETTVDGHIAAFVRPFDLGQAPLLRAALVRESAEQHVLLFDMHHIISDGHSINLLIRDLLIAYEGGAGELLPVQYKEYAAWQNEFFQGEEFQRQEQYWLDAMAGELPALELPLDKPRPAVKSFAGAEHALAIDAELTSRLKGLMAETGTTLNMVLLAAYQILLSRYTGAEDLLVGQPMEGREHADTEHVIGMFVNTLVLRGQPVGTLTIREYLEQVKSTALAAYAHASYPFERLLERLGHQGDRSRNPLFDAMFVLQNVDLEQLTADGLQMRPRPFEHKTAKFDLLLEATALGEEIQCSFEYATELFLPETIFRMARHYLAVLAEMAERPDGTLADVQLLSAAEEQELLTLGTGQHAGYPRTSTIHRLVEEQAVRTPDRIAVVCGEESLTYAELNVRANRLAHALREQGVQRGDLVSVMLERSPLIFVAFLGILKAGGAYLPLDPEYPEDRVRYMLEDSGSRVLVTERALDGIAPAAQTVLEADDERLLAQSSANPELEQSARDLAYIIYTSGTTGNPKGVMIEHRNVVRLLRTDGLQYEFSEQDVFSVAHSFCFDVSVWEMYGALFFGGTAVIVPKAVTQDPQQFRQLLEREGVTVLSQTPTAFSSLAQEDVAHPERALQAVRYVIFAGEALKPALLHRFHEKYPKTRLINMYGITETTVHSTFKEITEHHILHNESNIGRPIPTLSMYLFDRYGKLAPFGVTGEIYVGGDGVARGYLNRPELTSQRFLQNPYREETMYRSGDLARWLPGGEMEYLGRIDHQVKIRGFRIELGEVESRLLAHPAIEEVIVLDREDEQGQKYLCAYFVADAQLTLSALRTFLAQDLPGYMVPSYFVQLDALPRTANGKTDRRSLPQPDLSVALGVEYEAPRNETEEQLAAIWADVLGRGQLGINDDFFLLGGDSIKVIHLISRMNKQLSAQIAINDIYRHPTIKGLIDAGVGEAGAAGDVLGAGLRIIGKLQADVYNDLTQARLLPADTEDFYPLSKIQQSMVFYSKLKPDEPVYHDHFMYRLHMPDFAPDVFREALQMLVKRHSILRTTFHLATFSEAVQIVHRDLTPQILIEDVSGLPQAEQEARVKAYLEQDLADKFVFDGELLWRIGLFRLNEEEHSLILTVHHAVLDGWSVASLNREWIEIYQQLRAGVQVSPMPLGTSYKDYVAVQLGREADESTRRYWQETMAGYTRNKLPFNYSGKKINSVTVNTVYEGNVDADLYEKIDEVAQQHGLTFKEICLSAYLLLLNITTTEQDVVVGVVTHDRPPLEDGEKILGCFLNTVPVRMQVQPELTKLQVMQKVKDALFRIKPHELFLSDIALLIGDVQGGADNPIFDAIFNFTDFHVLDDEATQRAISAADGLDIETNEMTNTLFDLEVSKTMNRLGVRIKYSPNYFAREEIITAFELYLRLLRMFTEQLEQRVQDDQLLTAAEHQHIVYDFNDKVTPYPREQTLHGLFEAQAARTPHNTAIVVDEQTMTYGEVEAAANRLARVLQASGVEQNDHVGLVVSRSFAMIIGMLAILKAGAAYVPIDPEYPLARQEQIITSAGVKVALTDQAETLPVQTVLHFGELDLTRSSAEPLGEPKDASELAYIIYTSGSTGQPKGVMIEHHSAVNLIQWVNREFGVGEQDSLLFITSMCFDLSVYDIFGILASGGRIVLARKEQVQDTDRLTRLLKEHGITFWDSVPTTMNHLLNMIDDEGADWQQEALRLVFLSGDWIPVQLASRIKKYFPNARVISLGGATEATVWSNYYPILETGEHQTSIPYGVPIDNNFFYILDEQRRPVPNGVAGELYIGGVGVARGYMNDPERTNGSFVDNPFRPGERMYKTGDLGRLLPDGNMEFLGRIDHQVKIRGFRVELGEIESRLHKQPEVKEAVVLDRTDADGSKYLCAYVACDEELAMTVLREALAEELPAYMVPGAWVRLERLPLTPNGKIDRKALPEPERDALQEQAFVEPRTELEQMLADVYRQVLRVERIGLYDNFFERGGDSLKVTSLASRLRKALDVEIPLIQLFRTPTVAELAAHLETINRSEYQAISHVEDRDLYEASAAQKRSYILANLPDVGVSYNMPGVIWVEGPVDKARLELAFQGLIQRHEVLRTSFEAQDGVLMQRIHAHVDFKLDYREASEQDAESIVRSFIRPFDLHQAPLLRAMLVKTGPERYLFLYDTEHSISDGVSTGILIKEMTLLYMGETLPPLRIQYRDYAEWQNALFKTELFKRQEAFWLSQFQGGLRPLQLPTDQPRPAVQQFAGEKFEFTVGHDLLDELKSLANETGATLFMVMLAAFYILLAKYTGQEDIVVGTPIAGRHHGDLEHLLGMFVNTLALRNRPAMDKTYLQFLQEVQQSALGAYEHQDYPFDELIDKLDAARDVSRNPLFDTMFVLQNFEHAAIEAEDIKVTPYEFGTQTSKLDINLISRETEDGIFFLLEYASHLFTRQTMETFAAHFVTLLWNIVGNPQRQIAELDVQSGQELEAAATAEQAETIELEAVDFDF
ncbi:non-ribosomal peptide synthetase [Tumebacillus avium]|nr:non-ribosomal peptide synthetase [Tumebacillus avium]